MSLNQPGIPIITQSPVDITVDCQPLHLSNSFANNFENILCTSQINSLDFPDIVNFASLACQSQSSVSAQRPLRSTCSVSQSSVPALQTSASATCQTLSSEQPVFDDTSNNPVPIVTSSRKAKHNADRPCLFCGAMQTNLKRHLMSKHMTEEQVKDASSEENKDLRNAKFDKLRKDGIFNFNRNQLRNPDQTDIRIQRERSSKLSKEPTVYCTVCFGFYSSAYFHTHRKLCIKSTESAEILPRPAKSGLLAVNLDTTEDFKTEILSKFQNNEIGEICRTDECILLFGSRLFEKMKQKQDKAVEVKRSVMQDMRRVAHLYVEFKGICNAVRPTPVPCASSAEMLVRNNFDSLREAITRYTTNYESNELKSGLKNAIYFLILKLAKVQKAIYLVQRKDEKASEIEKFLEVLGLYQNLIFGDARYNINRNRQVKLRRPQQMPSEEEVLKLKTYTVQRMASIVTDEYLNWNVQSFVELRDLTMSRLTLFNARRGGEPARMTVQEWQDADNGAWLDPSRRPQSDEVDKELFRDLKVTFQGGKGNNHFVSILFPEDCYESMRKLSDPEVRACAEVSADNKYMFPCTQSSTSHVSGWHAVNRVCKDAAIESPELLTATKMRHRISTLYAGLDIAEKDRQQFYRHMGHAQEINEHVYQTPLAEAAILRVGVHLKTMDGNYKENATIQTATFAATSSTTLVLRPSDTPFQSADNITPDVVTYHSSPAVPTRRTVSDLTAEIPSQMDSRDIPAPKRKQGNILRVFVKSNI